MADTAALLADAARRASSHLAARRHPPTSRRWQRRGTRCWRASGGVSFGAEERTRCVRAAMRISVSSWATTDEDVERSLAAMVRAARTA